MSHVVVLGSNFAGLTAAIELKRSLGKDHEVSVISPSENFLYVWDPPERSNMIEVAIAGRSDAL